MGWKLSIVPFCSDRGDYYVKWAIYSKEKGTALIQKYIFLDISIWKQMLVIQIRNVLLNALINFEKQLILRKTRESCLTCYDDCQFLPISFRTYFLDLKINFNNLVLFAVYHNSQRIRLSNPNSIFERKMYSMRRLVNKSSTL